jgi:glucokinase
MTRYFLGVDIGGTKTRIGTVAEDRPERVVASSTVPTLKDDPGSMMVRISEEAARLAQGRLLEAGVGLPGPLDLKLGRTGALPNLPGWNGFAVRESLQGLLGVPVVMENDAKVAALGEMAFGAGKKYRDFVFVTLGTGIGGAVVAGGRLVSGALGGAGEIGHIQVDPDGPVCGCGRRGCVEAIASGPAIERAYGAGRPASEVFALAMKGDAQAREVLDTAGRALGAGLAAAVTLLEPEAIVFGGGIPQGAAGYLGSSGPSEPPGARDFPGSLAVYLDACRDEMRRRAYLPWKQDIPLLLATLGGDGPLLGAALLARSGWEGAGVGSGLMAQTNERAPASDVANGDTTDDTTAGDTPPEGTAGAPTPEAPRVVPKPWGEELWWADTLSYVAKRILVRAGQSLSLQYHRQKLETMFFASGAGILVLGDKQIDIRPGLSVTVHPGTRHRVMAASDVVFFEASTPEVDDVVRLEDAYGRAGRQAPRLPR